MTLGVALLQTDIGTNPDVMRVFATTLEELGYQHLSVYDHVLGAGVAKRPDWRGPYTSKTASTTLHA
jgi:hypothetical protein